MAVNGDTVGIIKDAQAMTQRIQDEHTRSLVGAWATAWDDLLPQYEDAVNAVLATADGDRVPQAALARSARLAKALEATRDQLVQLLDDSESRIVEDLPDGVQATVQANAGAIASQLPAEHAGMVVTWDRMDPAALAAIVERTTEQIHAAHWPLPDDVVSTMKKELVRGVAVGDNPRKTASRMIKQTEQRFNGGLNRAMTIARTETLDAHRAASKASNEANADVLARWEWIAALDKRTCIACAVQHGSRHPITEPGPLGHQNCRCTSVPVTKTWAELGIPGMEEFDDADSGLPDAKAWFDNLTPDSQLDVMGSRARLDAYTSGAVPWDRLAHRRSTDGWRDSYVPTPIGQLA